MENESISLSLHVLMVMFLFLSALLLVFLGKKAQLSKNLDNLDRNIAFIMGFIYALYNFYYFLPSRFNWETSLPLHVCDLLAPIAIISLLSNHRALRSILYFSATLLAGQAIATPVGLQDPATFRFWLFWILHAGIISISWYDVIVRNYRPKIFDLASVYAVNLIYILIILPINIMFDLNYGYIGASKPDETTIIDLLVDWPQRILLMIVIVSLAQCLMLLPWLVFRYNRKAPLGDV